MSKAYVDLGNVVDRTKPSKVTVAVQAFLRDAFIGLSTVVACNV